MGTGDTITSLVVSSNKKEGMDLKDVSIVVPPLHVFHSKYKRF